MKLTPEQEKMVEETKDWWIKFILNGGDEIDIPKATEGAKWLYEFCKFKEPKVFIADSPVACQEMANEINGTKNKFYNYAYESLGQSCGWTAYIDMFTKLGVIHDDVFEKYKQFLLSGVFMSIFLEEHAILCRRPLHVKLNERNDLHSTDSSAIAWRDGYKLFFLNGVPVTEEIVMTPAGQLDPIHIIQEKNAEVRREIVKKIGVERFVQKYGGVDLDTWKKNTEVEYRLVKLDIPQMRVEPVYLIMKNPSIGVWHCEGVDPKCKTVKEALAWRDNEDEYIEPDVLT